MTIAADIDKYIRHRFRDIRSNFDLESYDDSLPALWPSEEDQSALVHLALPLFIFASTVCRYISESEAAERLKQVLQQPTSGLLSQLQTLYEPILRQLVLADSRPLKGLDLSSFEQVVGAILLLLEPLSATSLGILLDMP